MFIKKRSITEGLLFLSSLIVLNNFAVAESIPWWDDVQINISVGKKEFLFGEPVFIKVRIDNKHIETVQVAAPLYSIFEFSVQDNSRKQLKKLKNNDISGLYRSVPIPTGTTFTDVAFINEYFDFPGIGTYKVTCRGDIRIYNGLPKDNNNVSSRYIPVSDELEVKINEGSSSEVEDVFRQYIKQLKSGDRKLENQAAHAIASSKSLIAVKLLKDDLLLQNTSLSMNATIQAAWALAHIDSNEAIQVLSDAALHSKNDQVRMATIIEIGRSRVVKSVPALIEALSDQNPNIRVAALNAIGKIGDKSNIEAVETKLSDSDERVRNVAQKIIYKLHTGDNDDNSNPKK